MVTIAQQTENTKKARTERAEDSFLTLEEGSALDGFFCLGVHSISGTVATRATTLVNITAAQMGNAQGKPAFGVG
jgi:hypothetical protein